MNVLTYTDTRARLKQVMDQVSDDKTPVLITRQNGEAVVMVALSDWNAIEETTHLLSTPANADRLRQAISQLDAGEGIEHEFPET